MRTVPTLVTAIAGSASATCDQVLVLTATSSSPPSVPASCRQARSVHRRRRRHRHPAIAIDFATKGQNVSIQFEVLFEDYPTCPSVAATSYVVTLTSLQSACAALGAQFDQPSAAGVNCTVTDQADYIWATTQVSLPPSCAAAVTDAGYSGS
ncbi:Aste57867_10298 [Aphanomyces stellatus]|uniref:Aste57867_10298 protein n=1 Tax=Aphanomyces stellatus TaxID=120398 RepID=A0A485KQI5_9STRA|nr:hypothetical protein As57867_010258 [Aphanomyces stellatus]VFT87172.1 Aste57867_10298 [Aphanomyces stellatus]